MIKLSDKITKRLKEVYKLSHINPIPDLAAIQINESICKYMDIFVCNNNKYYCKWAKKREKLKLNKKAICVNVSASLWKTNEITSLFGDWTYSEPIKLILEQTKTKASYFSNLNMNTKQSYEKEVNNISDVKNIIKYKKRITNLNKNKCRKDKLLNLNINNWFGQVLLYKPQVKPSYIIEENNLNEYNKDKIKLNNNEIVSLLNDQTKKRKNLKSPLIKARNKIMHINYEQKLLYKCLNKTDDFVITNFIGFDLIEDYFKNYIKIKETIGQNAYLCLFLRIRNIIKQNGNKRKDYAKNCFNTFAYIDEKHLKENTHIPNVKVYINVLDDKKKLIGKLYINDKGIKPFNKINKNIYIINTKSYKKSGEKNNPNNFIHKLTKIIEKNCKKIYSDDTKSIIQLQYKNAKVVSQYNYNNATKPYALFPIKGESIEDNKKEIKLIAIGDLIKNNIQKIQTEVELKIPLTININNNKRYITIKQADNVNINDKIDINDLMCIKCNESYIKDAKALIVKFFVINNSNINENSKTKDINNIQRVLCEVYVKQNFIFEPKILPQKLKNREIKGDSLNYMYPIGYL